MAKRRFYTPEDLAAHNCAKDIWVSINYKVFDLTELIQANRGPLAQPLIEVAGQDISHWFDSKTGGVKTFMDPSRGVRVPYTPHGRFLHVPPPEPTAAWNTDFGTAWWLDEDLIIGRLTEKTRKVQIVNVLTHQTDLLTVCSEETLEEIRDRYMEYNKHAQSYTWKKLEEDAFVPMDMEKTLDENGVPDESEEFDKLGIDFDYYYPVIHVYFNDDLTNS
uniref:Cytochrome b5 domain-containing protein 1 n=1 Tax=Florenciella parvula TaxID=236787 RepID=A0A7S2F938_9STRA